MREWQTVTVAFRPSSRLASGRPTSFDRADDHCLGPGEFGPGPVEQLDHPGRGAGHHSGGATCEQAGADRTEAVDVLGRVDRGDHPVGIDVIGNRQLNQDSVDRVVGAEVRDQIEQLRLGGLAGKSVMDRLHAGLFAGTVLVGDVDLGGRIVTDDDGGEGRNPTGRSGEPGHPPADFGPHIRGDLLAVDQFR